MHNAAAEKLGPTSLECGPLRQGQLSLVQKSKVRPGRRRCLWSA